MEGNSFIGGAVSTVVDSFGSLLTGIASTIGNTFDALFVSADGGISNIAAWGLMFLGVGLGAKMLRKFTDKAG